MDTVWSHKNYLAPPFPSHHLVINEALRLAEIKCGKDVVYDPACNDGRLPIRSVQSPFFAKYAVGIDIDEYLCKMASENVRKLKFQDKVKIVNKDLFECDLSEADVVFLYLTEHSNEKIRPKLEKELEPDTRVVSHSFEIRKWKPSTISDIIAPLGNDKKNSYSTRIYLYRMSEI
jgi:hypothetical protein